MLIARQSTARTITVGPVLDADGAFVSGGVVADFKIAKNGGAPAALNGSATLTHRHTGHYSLALTATDLDTVGTVEITIDDTVNSCAMKEISVIEEAVYDAFYAASAVGYVADQPVNVTKWLGTTVATPTVAGVPEVDVTHWAGSSAGSLPTNFSTLDISGGLVASRMIAWGAGSSTVETDGEGYPITIAYKYWDEGGLAYRNFPNNLNTVTIASNGVLVNDFTTAAKALLQTEVSDELTSRGYSSTRAGYLDNLSAGAVATAAALDAVDNFVDTEIADLSSRLPAALVSGRMDSNMQAAANDVITAAVIAAGAIDRASFAADTGLQTIRSNTAQGGGGSSITLDASASSTNDYYNGCTVYLTGGTGVGQINMITDYVGTTKVATTEAWSTAPDNTTTFAILPHGPADMRMVLRVENSAVGLSQAGDEYAADGRFTAMVNAIAPDAVNAAAIAADARAVIQSEATDALNAYDPPTNAEMEARTLVAASYATATALSTLTAVFTGITSLAQWLGLIAGKQTGNSTARTELRATGAGSGTFDETTDSMEAVRDALANQVKKNTALSAFPFKMVDETDHLTPETSLTITATRSLDGAAFASCANSATEIGSGWYKIDLAAADLNGNTVILKFTATGADTTEHVLVTQPT